MNSRLLHFLALSFLELLFVLFGKGLTYLNIDTTFSGVTVNIVNSSLALVLCGVLLTLLISTVASKSSASFWQSISNSLVLSLVTMLGFYGGIIQIFNWPYNQERTTPDFYVNSGFTFFLGLGLYLGALVIWVVFLVATLRPQESNRFKSMSG
jgi:hypothetical protein